MAKHFQTRYRAYRRPLWPMVVGLLGASAALVFAARQAVRVPSGVRPVSPFNVYRYMGHWYEIARGEHRFERGLERTTANYTLQDDGTVTVVNRGFDVQKKEWKEVTGRARFIDDTSKGSLKVSFFGPFYGGYHVIALDDDYRWALVMGSSLDYLWILSRTASLPSDVQRQLLDRAQSLGVDISKIHWVSQGVSQ